MHEGYGTWFTTVDSGGMGGKNIGMRYIRSFLFSITAAVAVMIIALITLSIVTLYRVKMHRKFQTFCVSMIEVTMLHFRCLEVH